VRPKWQDLVFTLGGALFIVALLPSVVGDNKPAASTSLLTAIVLYVYSTVYYSYRLWLSLATGLLTASLWLTLYIQVIT